MLCLAGFGNSNWVFERLAVPLGERFHLVMPDNRGMGKSPPAPAPYRLDDLASDALDLMDDLGQDRFAVVGLSMGGFVGQLLALKAPERVSALVLMCTTSGGPEFKKLFPSMTEEQVRAIYGMEPLARVQAALAPEICPLLRKRYPEVYEYVVGVRSRMPEDPAQVMLQFFAVSDFMERALPLEDLRCPALVLTGEHDPLVPLGNAELLRKRIKNAGLAVIEDTDHLFFLEKRDEVAGIIHGFLLGSGV